MILHQSEFHSILEKLCKTKIQSIVPLGAGVYGHCYGMTLEHAPHRAVVKVHNYPGVGEQERRQLITLRAHALVPVPQVYACMSETPFGELLVMEWLPGKGCPKPEMHPYALRKSLQEQAVQLLLQLHTIQHPQGYGSFDGPFYTRWWDYYGQRVYATYQAIHNSVEARTYLGSQVLALMDRTIVNGERIFATSSGQPVLLHGDFCFGNLLFDPQTWRISGLIDPLDAEWGERELDLVNAINGHIHHFSLVNRYRKATNLDACFPMRYWFYQVWKWLFYYLRVRVKCREWVLRCGHELEKAINVYL